MSQHTVPARWRVIAAFAAVYLIWGSTYLAMRFAIETIPPFLMGAVRYLGAGALLYAITRRRGAPTRLHWRDALIVGALLPFGGNGGVIWSQQFVPSSIAALIVATASLWMVLLNWVRGDRVRPTLGVILGIGLGLFGIALLVGIGEGGMNYNPIGIIVLLFAALAWASGSLYSRRAHTPADPLQATALQMLVASGLFIIAGIATGEPQRVRLDLVSQRSLFAVGYLIVFGSLIAYSAYVWILRVSTPTRASTYAFVNPVIAVFLGWALGGETITPRTIIATIAIVVAVALIVTQQSPARDGASAIAPVKMDE
ncbi:MAG: EamA family transporter [Chloroflexi bacterium]|nr:EamA family transporter [Chloroflexota bacterium]